MAVGTLAWRLRHAGEELAAGRSELHRLSRVSALVARGADPAEVIYAAQEELSGLLGLRDCLFEAAPAGFRTDTRLERSGVLSGTGGLHRLTRSGGFELPAAGVELPVLSRGQSVGRFFLVPTPGTGTTLEARVVAVALADQVGAAFAAKSPPVAPSLPSSARERGN